MFFVLVLSIFGVCAVEGIIPVAPLEDCPNISPVDGLKIEQATGPWRLAYLLVDDNEDFEEDSTCAVAEILQVNETKLEVLLYVDGRKDEDTIDRYIKDFDVTIKTPGEWLFHTSFAGLEFLHVTVIGYSSKHLILTFCVDPFINEETTTEPPNEYDSFLNSLDKNNDLIKLHNYNQLFREMDEFPGRLSRHRRVRRPSRLLRGKRNIKSSPDVSSNEEFDYEKMVKFLKSRSTEKPKKHLWTVVLVKDNNTSALRFVETASMLLKYGFKIKEGQLVSFGSCSLTRK